MNLITGTATVRRLAIPAAFLLTLVAVALLLWTAGPAQAQGGDAPPVDNLHCIVRTDVVGFFWEEPQWSGGDASSYDYQLTLPDGRREGGNLRDITSVIRWGAYQTGQAARFSVTANYETPSGSRVAGEEATLTCWVGGKPAEEETPTPTPTPTPTLAPQPVPLVPEPDPNPQAQGQSTDYDADNDGLIEVSSLAQLNAIRWNLDGDGSSADDGYSAAFPNPTTGMGCPMSGCVGYELAAALDFDTNENGSADSGDDYWNGGRGWMPIGTDTDAFSAIFEGNGRVISNLHVASDADQQGAAGEPGHKGLFKEIGAQGVVRNVGLEDVDVSRTVPCLEWHDKSCVMGYVGGLAGVNRGKISGSWVTGSAANAVTTPYKVHGNNPITVGGLVGFASTSSVISGSYSTASVSARKNYWKMFLGSNVGGLVGENKGSIIASYATGSVFSDGSDSYVSGQSPAHYVGGLVGDNRGTITASYSNGRVLGNFKRSGLVGIRTGGLLTGGFVTGPGTPKATYRPGHGTTAASYWDTETSGRTASAGGVGKTTAQLQGTTETSMQQNYTPYAGIYADWNVDLDGDGSPDDPWDFGTSSQYPVLSALGVAKQRQQVQSALSEQAQPWAITYSVTARTSATEGQDAILTITLSEAVPAGLPIGAKPIVSYARSRAKWGDVEWLEESGMRFIVMVGYGGSSTASAADTGGNVIPIAFLFPTGETTFNIAIPTRPDDLDENDETFTVTFVALAADWGPAGVGKNTATITITDDDTAGVTVTAANPLAITEGGSATYTVVLDSQPTADVTVAPTSGDGGAAAVSPASHTFKPSNWNTPATFTVSGVADTDTNNETVGISHRATSQDSKYNGILVSTVSVSVSDTTTSGLQLEQQQQQSPRDYTDLIAQMYEWRNDPQAQQYGRPHTYRWDRALLAMGEAVSDTSVTAMTAAEAQALADQAWGTRWVPVAAALKAIEAAAQQPANQAPTVSSAIADATIVSESGTHQVSLSGVFSDADNDGLTVTAASSDTAKATVSVAADYSSLTVAAKARGTATITVTASDGNGGTVADTFTVTVKAAPVVASALADVSLAVDGSKDISVSGVFSDADGDSLTITAASSDETKATVTVAADQSKLTLTGVAVGTATITVTARDADGNTVSDAFDAPVAKKYAALIAQMYEWRNGPEAQRYGRPHTFRWDRALLAMGETVSDASVTPMTAAEAQALADQDWGARWIPVAAALREIEAG